MSEFEKSMEQGSTSSGPAPTKTFQLRDAIDMGEYNPEYLATFAEWHTLSKTMQWNLLKKALDNRERQLLQQWAEVNNVIDFRLKPELKKVLKKIWENRAKVVKDKEALLIEYS